MSQNVTQSSASRTRGERHLCTLGQLDDWVIPSVLIAHCTESSTKILVILRAEVGVLVVRQARKAITIVAEQLPEMNLPSILLCARNQGQRIDD